MNKFKKVLLGALSILTLGLFVVSGSKVNAATVNNSFDFDLSEFAKIKKNETGSTKTTATASPSGDKMDLTFTISTAFTGADSQYNSNGYYQIGIKSDGANASFTLTFTMNGSGNASFSYDTGGSSRHVDLSIDGGSAIDLHAGSETTYSINSLAKGDHTLTFTGTSSSNSNFKLYSFAVNESYSTSAFDSMDSVSIVANKSFYVGDTVTYNDLIVMATYEGESSTEITKYTFKVYDSNDEEVTGAFTTAGDGYYVVATSTEKTTESATSSTFSVGEQTKYTYDFSAYALTDLFATKTDNKYTKHDYTTDDNVLSLTEFIRSDNSNEYSFADGEKHSGNFLQGSLMTLTLSKAAKITVYAVQSGSTAATHGVRYMYFEDENNNSIASEMNFSMKNVTSSVKVFSINLAAGTYTTHSSDGSFNFFAIVIDYADSASLDTTHATVILEHSTGTAISGSGTAARFVGVLKNVDAADITSITLDLVLTLNDTDKTVKNAKGIEISTVYTGLPGYNDEDTLYFYYVITGLERTGFEGCTIKGTATIVMGTSKGYSTTTWTNA